MRLSEILVLYSWLRVGSRKMFRQSVFPSHSGRVFIPWRLYATVFRLILISVVVWSVMSMPLEIVPQSVTLLKSVLERC